MRARIALAALPLAALLGCAEATENPASAGADMATPTAPLPEAPISADLELADLDTECHFGSPDEVDEYNGLVYLTEGNFQPLTGMEQVVDMWGGDTPDFHKEMPDDISWTCNSAELLDNVGLELVAHNDYPDDIAGFRLRQLGTPASSRVWFLTYTSDPDDRAFRRQMVLKLWNVYREPPLLDSVPVTVASCLHRSFKSGCIQRELEGGGG